MKKRSFLAAFLAATMLLLSLVSCNPTQPEESTSTPESSESTTQKPVEEILVPSLPELPAATVDITTVRKNFEADPHRGSFSFEMTLASSDKSLENTELELRLLGSYVTEDNKKTDTEETFSVTGLSDALTIESAAKDGFKSGIYSLRVYKKSDKSFLGEALHFSLCGDDEFRAYILTDTHYTGTNANFDIYNYTTEEYVSGEGGVKNYNNYTAEYDNYGWTSDEKIQRVMDDILMRYQTGEIHMVFILGDAAMNDGNYYHFAQDHVKYHTGTAYLQNGVLLPPGTPGLPSTTPSTHYGDSILDFWDSPLNVSYLYREKFMTQLADAGVPYYIANGNHEYQFYYNEDKTDIDYTPWEDMYHYQELFGHKNAQGEYTDATSVDFLVRVIRRDGEFKVLSALSTSDLAAFKERNKNDGNCYDFYVSEDSVTASDTLVTAFMMVNPHQIDTYDKYMTMHITYDIATKQYSYQWQTLRPSYYQEDILMEIGHTSADFSNVWIVSHHHSETNEIARVIAAQPNIRGSFFGDVHTEETYKNRSGIPSWVVGYYSHSYDIDSYFVKDPATGKNTSTPDNQYYYDRGNPKVANKIWGDTMRHPFNHVILHVQDTMAYVEREHQAVYYANDWQERLTFDWVRGWDKDYARAVDFSEEIGTSFKEGNRTVYVGGVVGSVGTEWAYIGKTYVKNKYNKPEYIIKPATKTRYSVCDLSGNEIGGTVGVSTIMEEGEAFTYKGETYYLLSKIGGVSGHYLYDENGNYVYKTKNDDLAFYTPTRDANGNLVKEYFYMNDKDQFVALGEWQNGSYVLKDGIYTDIRLYKAGTDHIKQANGKWNVKSGKIEIQNGVIVRGEGFTGFSYAHSFVDGNGNAIPKSDIALASDGYGYYAPREAYNGQWILFD